MNQLRVLIVDDEPLVCRHLSAILSAAPDVVVVGTAADGAEAVEAVVRERPDLVLMDLRMPGVDGLAATERIRGLVDPPVVLVLTTFDADGYVIRALRAGAAGYLVKSTPPAELIDLIRVAAQGHTVLSPVARDGLVAASATAHEERAAALARVTDLTDRERDVLTAIGDGLTNAEIARRLHLSETTVKGYVSHLFEKLGCANRTQAGLLAQSAGWTTPVDYNAGVHPAGPSSP
ncbi:response regulator transcription factor [Actinoplanes sp. TRM 88003]|uniref:Response regulator transcription factor n=1 Tax=Paractinoplanes aksuensis TaxID=2939490 RepID=A0ABT1DH79_9ACTN|nr:response regulator transcription factor [Actinoplanes aksuensis]MCO8270189.1 response regulator transcription factor [Actinoplanes aksuensis]